MDVHRRGRFQPIAIVMRHCSFRNSVRRCIGHNVIEAECRVPKRVLLGLGPGKVANKLSVFSGLEGWCLHQV